MSSCPPLSQHALAAPFARLEQAELTEPRRELVVYAGLTGGCQGDVMRFATLISWMLTASLGGFMLRTWLVRGAGRRS